MQVKEVASAPVVLWQLPSAVSFLLAERRMVAVPDHRRDAAGCPFPLPTSSRLWAQSRQLEPYVGLCTRRVNATIRHHQRDADPLRIVLDSQLAHPTDRLHERNAVKHRSWNANRIRSSDGCAAEMNGSVERAELLTPIQATKLLLFPQEPRERIMVPVEDEKLRCVQVLGRARWWATHAH